MPFRPRRVLAFDPPGLIALNETLDEIGRGIGDANIHGGADIALSKLRVRSLGFVDLGTAETAIPHRLPVAAAVWIANPTSDIRVYETRDPDLYNIYLAASAAGTARILVGG